MKKIIRGLAVTAVLTAAMATTAFAATDGYTTDEKGVVTYDGTASFSASYSEAAEGGQYALLVVAGTADNYSITTDSILYIDQTAADADGVSFTGFIPKTVTDSVVLLGGEFEGASSPVVLGTIKAQYKLGDLNGDGKVNAQDNVLLMQGIVKGVDNALTATQKLAADLNEDGRVNGQDNVLLMQMILKPNS